MPSAVVAPLVVAGVAGVADNRSFSRFFSSVRRNAFKVVRRALFGLHRSEEIGVCAQTGQVSGSDAWPVEGSLEWQESITPNREGMRTGFAYRLVAAGETKGVDGKLIAHGASQLERNLILGERAR